MDFLLLFVAFNLWMLISIVAYLVGSSEAEIGETTVFGPVVFFWAAGAVVLGVLAFPRAADRRRAYLRSGLPCPAIPSGAGRPLRS